LQEKWITPCIPGRKSRNKAVKYDKRHYKRRNRIEILLAGFDRAYNQRRQRVLEGKSPHLKVEERIKLIPSLANFHYKVKEPEDLKAKVDDVLYYANDVSQPVR